MGEEGRKAGRQVSERWYPSHCVIPSSAGAWRRKDVTEKEMHLKTQEYKWIKDTQGSQCSGARS